MMVLLILASAVPLGLFLMYMLIDEGRMDPPSWFGTKKQDDTDGRVHK